MSQFLPNPKYNPEFQEEINAKTKLQPGISMAKFLGGVGWADTIEHITPNQLFEDKLKLAKQYHMHAVALSGIAELDDFAYHRVRVAEYIVAVHSSNSSCSCISYSSSCSSSKQW